MKQIYFLPSSTSSSGGRSPLLSIDLPHKIPRRTVLRRLHPAISHDRHNVTGLLSRGAILQCVFRIATHELGITVFLNLLLFSTNFNESLSLLQSLSHAIFELPVSYRYCTSTISLLYRILILSCLFIHH